MSGLEVIGVVLGMWPIVAQTVSMYKAMKTGSTVAMLTRKLRTEKIVFHEFVRKLIASEVAEADVPKHIDPARAADTDPWRDKGLRDRLEKQLGHEKMENVCETAQEILKLLRTLNSDLTDIPRGMDLLEKMKSRARTVKLSFNQGSIYDRLKHLSDLNLDLSRLLSQQPMFRRLEKEEKDAVTAFLHRDCREPSELYETIRQSYACSCHDPHVANLGIHCPCCHWPSEVASKKHQWNFELVFPPKKRIARAKRSASDGDNKPSAKDEVGVYSSDDEFCGPRPLPMARSRSVSLSLENRPALSESTPVVRDLCSLVESVNGTDCLSSQVLGMIQRQNSCYRLCINQSNSENSANMVCLQELLDPSTREALLRRERMLLAFGLSKAVLQFWSTPWLGDAWSWKNFSVLSVEEGGGGRNELSHLFVQHIFYSVQFQASQRQAANQRDNSALSLWKEPVLTRLGIALIELALGRTLREIRHDELQLPDVTMSNGNSRRDCFLDLSNIDTAFKLLETGRIARAESQIYEDVVRACLSHQYRDRHNAGIKGLNSRDKSFYDNAEESIIIPLYQVCYNSGWELRQMAVM